MTLRVITAPATEPVSAATAKTFLRVDGTDDDTLITLLIKAAREQGESLSRRAFITQTIDYTLDAWPEDDVLTVPRPPLLTVVSVKYRDEDGTEATLASANYVVDVKSEPGRIIFLSTPDTTLQETGGITVQYTAGYGAADTNVPERLKTAILALVAYWYENRMIGDVPASLAAPFISERVVWF